MAREGEHTLETNDDDDDRDVVEEAQLLTHCALSKEGKYKPRPLPPSADPPFSFIKASKIAEINGWKEGN